MICHWCKQRIDPKRQVFVRDRQELPNGGTFEWRYHARTCYTAWREFRALHAMRPDEHE